TYDGLHDRAAWASASIALPDYDPAALAERTKADPRWVHFGIGNIFRVFLGGIADRLIREGALDRGITCVETFDGEIVDRIYAPHDNLALAVTLHGDGRKEKRVLGSCAEALNAQADRARLREIFIHPGLQLVSFTITEKGYALRGADGEYLPGIRADLEGGPKRAAGAMGVVAAMLYERWRANSAPLALVSMDNVSQNGKRLRESVLEIARVWRERGLADAGLLPWLEDESRVSFPWTMIDKITPRPAEAVARALAADGVEDMEILVTAKQTYIAPFVNAEAPGYLVIEDSFPNGRPPLERAGVYMTERETVKQSERMKVTACLNPIHTALCTYDRLLGFELFADGMRDPELAELARRVGYDEGLPVVEDPGILSPRAFLDEVLSVRFPNPYLGDTSARIAVDISQMLGIRFGETVKAYVRREGSAERLTAIPLAIAGWLRYLLAVDDAGKPFELSPDPMLPELRAALSGLVPGRPDTLGEKLKPILSNERIFGVDLYSAGIGEKIETMLRAQLASPGAVRRTLKAYLKP
ncbi:MAG: mannitol dehydrogenase family protein, partial [Oscillospiraceae bacterium]|nr:mannitol dehydrogenase family protein [Oscillospiraceae bacterium]